MLLKNILIADDHPIVREGLKQIITRSFSVMQVDEVSTSQEIMDHVQQWQYDLIVLDISLPGRNGLEVLKQLRQQQDRTPVLIVSVHPEKHYAIRALKAGANGYLNKMSVPADLVKAIRVILQGRRYVSPALAELLASHIAIGTPVFPHERLTDRELEVLCLLASGKSVSQIAKELFLSVKTVSAHRAHILRKMHAANNAELMHYALSQGLTN